MAIECNPFCKRGVLLCLGAGMIPPVAADDALVNALAGGQFNVELRPRYEFVQQDGKPSDAHAFTLRTILGYGTKPIGGLSAKLEFSNVVSLADEERYNDTQNGLVRYPVVADPESTKVNQAFLNYAGLPDTQLRLGRQLVNLANQRFFGSVDWRQSPQTFDAVTVENKSLPNTTLFAGYLFRTKSSYANFQLPAGLNLQPMRTYVLHADVEPVRNTHLVAYGYLYDDKSKPDGAASNISSQTYGIRLDGAAPGAGKLTLDPSLLSTVKGIAPGQYRILYTAEYAKQSDYADGRPDVDASYWHLGAGVAAARWYLRADYEVLGANDTATYAFQTPFATKHPLNGWANMFTATPATGLKDLHVTASANVAGPLNLWAVYHQYRSDAQGLHYGNELDLLATYQANKNLLLAAKYADYSAKDGEGAAFPGTTGLNADTRKAWMYLIFKYPGL
ncbi:alginate export family protein [Thermithiobacillus tepidarius DSM 3134]|uniref:alginate export family protein n=1 Tax=Thermithiobacillus tepidarius TaxID=929 RepID=UPI00040251A2|nr:alginate export family protein [Thermithiobacillus tepidarius]